MNDFTTIIALLHTAATMFVIIVPSVFAVSIALWVRSAAKAAKAPRRVVSSRYHR